MSKKVLILSGSPGRVVTLIFYAMNFCVERRMPGTKQKRSGSLRKKVAPCSGCYYCSTHGGACVHKDDMADILQR